MTSACRLATSLLAFGAALLLGAELAQGQAGGSRATAAVEGTGEVIQVAPDQLMVQTMYSGIAYFDDERVALDGTIVRCPSEQTIDLESKRVSANGHCTFTADDGSSAFSEWKCTGARGSCEGELVLTGGTGRFEGISGGGKMQWRAALADKAAELEKGGVVWNSSGLLSWPSFTTRMRAR